MGRRTIGQSKGKPVDLSSFPNFIGLIHNPILYEPPLCTLKELQDGTYNIDDLMMLNELIDLKEFMKEKG